MRLTSTQLKEFASFRVFYKRIIENNIDEVHLEQIKLEKGEYFDDFDVQLFGARNKDVLDKNELMQQKIELEMAPKEIVDKVIKLEKDRVMNGTKDKEAENYLGSKELVAKLNDLGIYGSDFIKRLSLLQMYQRATSSIRN